MEYQAFIIHLQIIQLYSRLDKNLRLLKLKLAYIYIKLKFYCTCKEIFSLLKVYLKKDGNAIQLNIKQFY